MAAGARQQRIIAARRQARWLGAGGFLVALCAPVALFHRVVEILAADFKLDVQYLSGWVPWFLLAGGLAFLLPARGRRAWIPRAAGSRGRARPTPAGA